MMLKQDYGQASEYIEKMINIYERLKQPYFIAQGYFNMALIRMSQENFQEAHLMFRISRDLYKENLGG